MATELTRCFAIAAPGLEPLVARELSALGEQPQVEAGGVSWMGDARSIMRANRSLRVASRVLVRVARFRAAAFYELEAHAKRIAWDRFLAAAADVDFRVTSHKSRLYHSDAIAERFMRAASRALGLRAGKQRKAASARGAASPKQLFVVRVVNDWFEVSADSSGELLHRRGYRQAVGKAPLRETLAAALLIAADWRGDSPIVDPFCGSGTIPIEAALLARGLAPGRSRRFAFMEWPDFDEELWRQVSRGEGSNTRVISPVDILGSDRDAGAIASALANASRAGVAPDIAFSQRSFSAIEPPMSPGLIATNPPYGVRVGRDADLRNLFAQFGKVLRQRCRGWRVAVYTPDERSLGHTQLPLTRAFRTSNGGIRVSAFLGTVE